MAKEKERICPACGKLKLFRIDQKTCGCAKAKGETSEVTKDSWAISIPTTRIHTLEQLIAHFQIDLTVWEVERFVANKWEVGTANEGGGIQVEPLFQVKAFLRRKRAVENARKEIDALKELAKKYALSPPKWVRTRDVKLIGNMLELNLTDHHFGKMAWGRETGDQNYDTKIAEKVFNRAFFSLLERSKSISFDEIWFVVGNDLFNSDDVEGRTTKGTYVSTDVRYQKTFSVVRTLMVGAIEELRKRTKKVKVILVSGNHDQLSVWHLGDSLECYFHKYSDVAIDNEPKYRKYHRFGSVMIMYTHGDKGKRLDYPLLMATEQPEMFGATKFREAHTGHIHTRRVEEQHGVVMRILSALCPPDAWHAEQGFVGNLRSSEAFIWNRDEGMIGSVIYTDNGDDIEENPCIARK